MPIIPGFIFDSFSACYLNLIMSIARGLHNFFNISFKVVTLRKVLLIIKKLKNE